MTALPPLIIASCPGRSLEAVHEELKRAAGARADLAEVRIDRLPPSERLELGRLFPSPIPLVATLRSRAEGGEGPDALEARAVILETARRLPFRFIDLERARDRSLLPSSRSASPSGPFPIVSSHLRADVPTPEIRRLLELERPANAVVKVVIPCEFGRFWADLLPGLESAGSYGPFILHTTGPTGPVLRAWARRLEMFAVFGSLPSPPGGDPPETVEPTQLPVDQLRRHFHGHSAGPLFGVVGHPIEHSRSPALHAFWMEREDRSGLYLALDMSNSQDLSEALVPLAAGGFRGLNVTHPWKPLALTLASRAGPAAEAAGCANTLTFEPDGISAENTDVAAVRRRLLELKEEGTWDGTPVVVLGGGGAARAALAAVASLGATSVIVTRRSEVSEGLAREYAGVSGAVTPLSPSRLVIHATPAGREGVPSLDLPWADAVGPGTHLLDFVYQPTHPFLRLGVEARSATYEDGSRLLVYQAAESYAIWWGTPPAQSLQEAALREVLCTA